MLPYRRWFRPDGGPMEWRCVSLLALLSAMGCEGGGIGAGNTAGFLQSCLLPEDCPEAEMVCVQVSNQYSGFLTEDRYCTYECGDESQCPDAQCADFAGTELACLDSVVDSSYCGQGRLGDQDFTVCGI